MNKISEFLRKYSNKSKIDNLQEDKKFEYYMRFRDIPLIPVNIQTLTLFMMVSIVFIFTLHMAYFQTGMIEEYSEGLKQALMLIYNLGKIMMIILIIDIVMFSVNFYYFIKEKKEYLKKYGKK